MVGTVFFAFGFTISLLTAKAEFWTHVGAGAMTAGIAFLAAIALWMRDDSKQRSLRDNARRRLTARDDVQQDLFAMSFEPADRELAIHLRHRVAEFFSVPDAKVRSDDALECFAFEERMPVFYLFVMAELCEKHQIPSLGSFPKTTLKSFASLVEEAKLILRERSSDGIGRDDAIPNAL